MYNSINWGHFVDLIYEIKYMKSEKQIRFSLNSYEFSVEVTRTIQMNNWHLITQGQWISYHNTINNVQSSLSHAIYQGISTNMKVIIEEDSKESAQGILTKIHCVMASVGHNELIQYMPLSTSIPERRLGQIYIFINLQASHKDNFNLR